MALSILSRCSSVDPSGNLPCIVPVGSRARAFNDPLWREGIDHQEEDQERPLPTQLARSPFPRQGRLRGNFCPIRIAAAAADMRSGRSRDIHQTAEVDLSRPFTASPRNNRAGCSSGACQGGENLVPRTHPSASRNRRQQVNRSRGSRGSRSKERTIRAALSIRKR